MMAAGELTPGLDISRVTAEPPRDASHGDVTTNAAMVVAKPAGMAPKVLAEMLVQTAGKTTRCFVRRGRRPRLHQSPPQGNLLAENPERHS